MKAAAYLEFACNAKDVIETYRDVFNAEVVCEYAFDKGMTDDEMLVGKIFHAELKIGDLNLYLSDTNQAPSFASLKFVIETPDEAEAHQYFEKMARKGRVISHFEKMPFGPTIAQVEDQFGIRWDLVVC